jgi:hypothetical protein
MYYAAFVNAGSAFSASFCMTVDRNQWTYLLLISLPLCYRWFEPSRALAKRTSFDRPLYVVPIDLRIENQNSATQLTTASNFYQTLHYFRTLLTLPQKVVTAAEPAITTFCGLCSRSEGKGYRSSSCYFSRLSYVNKQAVLFTTRSGACYSFAFSPLFLCHNSEQKLLHKQLLFIGLPPCQVKLEFCPKTRSAISSKS